MPYDPTPVSPTRLPAASLEALLPGLSALRNGNEGDPSICIALLDGPVDLSHPCFDGASLTPVNTIAPHCVTGGSATRHGTHIASLLFGQPGSPLHGLVPRCRGLLLPIFRDMEDGRVRAAMQLDLARAILQAVALGANIINVSGGELVASPEADPYLTNAVRLCADSGVLLVAAAGNDACDCLHVPAALDGTLVVGAMDLDGIPLPQSNWAAAYASRGVLAPGQNIPGAELQGGIAHRSGTSFSAALVSGVAALVMSEQIRLTGSADGPAVADAILRGASPCNPTDDCRRLFRGRLDIPRTQSILLKGGGIQMSENEQTTAAPPAEIGGITPSAITSEGVLPSCGCGGKKESECSCKSKEPEKKSGGCGSTKPTIAYALGRIGFDFGSEARRDSFVQAGLRNPYDPNQLLAHLETNPWAAQDVIFTLEQDSTPIYAIQGGGPFADHVYERLREFLGDHVSGDADTVSLPGYVGTTLTLANGQTVPVLWPNPRGMYSWSRGTILNALVEANSADAEQRTAAIGNFLDRVYYDLRNLGVDPRERAINFAATNAFQVARVYESAIRDSLALDTISVERSPICRPNSDCWDVSLTFFDPNNRLTRSRRIYRFTVDVSDVIPVTIGTVRNWDVF
jgi:PatG C-terminal/Subtilase family/PatG Domain